MTGDERIYVFSASKLITSTAALTLLEQGKFILSDPICKYLPEWENMQVLEKKLDGTETLRPANGQITVGDLFAMTSGLDYDGKLISSEVLKELGPTCPTREIVRRMAEHPLHFDPGTHWCYGYSHDVLGALVGVVSGERFGDYCKRVIFEPLGMNKTSFGIDNSLRPTLATLYEFNDELDKYERRQNQDNFMVFGSGYDSGGAGVVSTVSDMAKFCDMLACSGKTRSGVRILASHTVELMKKNRLVKSNQRDLDWDTLVGYGYGLGVRTLVDQAAAGSPSPVGEFGWTGAAGAYLLCDTENKLSMFYAHHMLNNQESYTASRLRNILYSCLD